MEYDYRRDSLEELQLSRLNNSDIIYCFLHCNPNLKSLCLNDCDFEELKPDAIRRPGIGVVPKLKSLTLTNMHESYGFPIMIKILNQSGEIKKVPEKIGFPV
ncbi:hypothetical protein HN51_021410 [Arachis hypogaea]